MSEIKDSELQALTFTLQRQDEQSKVLQKVITAVVDIKDDVTSMRDEMKRDVEELRDSIPLTYEEDKELKSYVAKKSAELTRDFFNRKVSDELFLSKLGHFRMAIYKRLNETLNTPRVTAIKRIDFNQAKKIIDFVSLDNLTSSQKRITITQEKIAELKGDNISDLIKKY